MSKGFLSFIKRAEADIVAEATRAEEEAKARETEANAKASEVSAESEGVKTDAVKKILKSQKSIKKSEKLERKLSTRANALSGEKAAEVMKEMRAKSPGSLQRWVPPLLGWRCRPGVGVGPGGGESNQCGR